MRGGSRESRTAPQVQFSTLSECNAEYFAPTGKNARVYGHGVEETAIRAGASIAQGDGEPTNTVGGVMRPKGAADGHPRGTLAIVAVYALLFVGGWIAMYAFVFLSRGNVTP